ncbi:GNAT family N-acetyltransferase [Micromonospora sp. NPDC005299]|uniref:GNAT family N-acetyltransferase n=1 Tax=Micromonospora sp. NPDC005299 TaxID=3364231 RepID=UPI0036A2A06A
MIAAACSERSRPRTGRNATPVIRFACCHPAPIAISFPVGRPGTHDDPACDRLDRAAGGPGLDGVAGRPGPDLRHLLRGRGDALAGRRRGADDRPGRGARAPALLARALRPYAGRWGLWAIEPRGAGRAVGSVLLKPLPGRAGVTPTDDIEVGWHLHPDAQGHGYATEAARAVLGREFATGTRQVHAVVMAGNEPSMAVARGVGRGGVRLPAGAQEGWGRMGG